MLCRCRTLGYRARGTVASGQALPIRKRIMNTILLVDDSEAIVRTLSAFLTKAGYRVIAAADGKAGLRAARKEDPDLILLDVAMPGLDGIQVLKKLNADKRTRYIPVIMLSGIDEDEVKEEASYHYAEQYITKPANLSLLKSRIERTISRHKADT